MQVAFRGVIDVDAQSFIVAVTVSFIAGLTTVLLPRSIALPAVVVELLLGIAVGPQVLELARPDEFMGFLANLGLGFLFFFAGYELDLQRVKGRPLRLAALGWLVSLALAYSVGGALAVAGIVVSLVYTGSALATTALGTVLPIVSDAGQVKTRFGRYLMGAGAVGEFGPIILVTIALSSAQPLHEAALLLAFVVLAAVLAALASRAALPAWLTARIPERGGSSQLAVRVAVLLVFALVWLAEGLGLEVLLGGFLGGMVTRAAMSRNPSQQELEPKLMAIGFGFLIPFFFVYSGMNFDLDALTESSSALLKVPLFLALMLLVRGLPVMLLYRSDLDASKRRALALLSATQLPLVVAITTIAVEGGHMKPDTAAALVGAALLSTILFPKLALRLLRA